jgi:predicted dehydrogenase
MYRLHVGLVGAGGHARVYTDHLRRVAGSSTVGEIACVAQYVHPGDAAATVPGARVYREIDPFLDDLQSAGAVLALPTPIHTHHDLSLKAFARGLHVLCEKPIAGSYAEGLAMTTAACEANRILAIGYQFGYLESTCRIMEALDAGVIGQVETVDVISLWPRNGDYFRRNAWAGQLLHEGLPVRDSPLNNACAHFLHLAMMFADLTAETVQEHADSGLAGTQRRANPIESADTQVLTITIPGGVRLSAVASHAVDRLYGPRLRVRGAKGELRWDLHADNSLSYRIIAAEGERILDAVENPDMACALRTLQEALCPDAAKAGAARRKIERVTRFALAQSAAIEGLVRRVPIATVPPSKVTEWQPPDDIYVGPTRDLPVLYVRDAAASMIEEFETT